MPPSDLQVGGSDARGEVPTAGHLNVNERDPHGIHHHLKVAFEDIFAEPHPSIFSFDVIWRVAFQVFTVVKLWTYRILSLIFGVPAACCWGFQFGCLAFCHIWCCYPAYRYFMTHMRMVQMFLEAIMNCCISPICLSLGKCFGSFRVHVIQGDYKNDGRMSEVI